MALRLRLLQNDTANGSSGSGTLGEARISGLAYKYALFTDTVQNQHESLSILLSEQISVAEPEQVERQRFAGPEQEPKFFWPGSGTGYVSSYKM
jgi:hypothetical protein